MISPALVITIAIQVACQAFKVIYYSIRHRRLEAERFISTGGMPSAHSAFVAALTVSVGLVEGWGSGAFTVAVVLAAVVVFDALRLRRIVDRHSRLLQELVTLLPEGRRGFTPMVVGHSVGEVAAGVAAGAGMALAAYLLFLA